MRMNSTYFMSIASFDEGFQILDYGNQSVKSTNRRNWSINDSTNNKSVTLDISVNFPQATADSSCFKFGI